MTYSTRKEVVARSLRMSGTVCFIFLIFSSNQYLEKGDKSDPFWKLLPMPILVSLILSVTLALSAQVWLKKLLRLRRSLESEK